MVGGLQVFSAPGCSLLLVFVHSLQTGIQLSQGVPAALIYHRSRACPAMVFADGEGGLPGANPGYPLLSMQSDFRARVTRNADECCMREIDEYPHHQNDFADMQPWQAENIRPSQQRALQRLCPAKAFGDYTIEKLSPHNILFDSAGLMSN